MSGLDTSSAEFFEEFIEHMQSVMIDHDHRKACEWKFMNENMLIENFMQKVHEFEIAEDSTKQLVDIAAYAYFLWARKKYPWRFS